jgi:hypothetical protein
LVERPEKEQLEYTHNRSITELQEKFDENEYLKKNTEELQEKLEDGNANKQQLENHISELDE